MSSTVAVATAHLVVAALPTAVCKSLPVASSVVPTSMDGKTECKGNGKESTRTVEIVDQEVASTGCLSAVAVASAALAMKLQDVAVLMNRSKDAAEIEAWCACMKVLVSTIKDVNSLHH